MESETLTFEPLEQFVVQPLDVWNWSHAALIWLEVSIIVLQVSIVCFALMGFPLWRLLPRVGLSKWWALAAVCPPFALILFWIAGFKTPSSKE